MEHKLSMATAPPIWPAPHRGRFSSTPVPCSRPRDRRLALLLTGLALWVPSVGLFAQDAGALPPLDSVAVVVSFGLFLAITVLHLPKVRGLQEQSPAPETCSDYHSSDQAGNSGAYLTPESIGLPELLDQIERCIQHCRRYSSELTVLRLTADELKQGIDATSQTAITQVLLNISRFRGARLYQLGSEDYLAVFFGELPDEAWRIAEAYRQSVVDLDLGTDSQPLTISVGMCSGPPDSKAGARQFFECAGDRLESARQLGGNRVEAWQG